MGRGEVEALKFIRRKSGSLSLPMPALNGSPSFRGLISKDTCESWMEISETLMARSVLSGCQAQVCQSHSHRGRRTPGVPHLQ